MSTKEHKKFTLPLDAAELYREEYEAILAKIAEVMEDETDELITGTNINSPLKLVIGEYQEGLIDTAQRSCEHLANNVITPVNEGEESYFITQARKLFAAATAAQIEDNLEPHPFNRRKYVGEHLKDITIYSIVNFCNTLFEQRIGENRTALDDYFSSRDEDDFARITYGAIISASLETKDEIMRVLRSKIAIFANESLDKLPSKKCCITIPSPLANMTIEEVIELYEKDKARRIREENKYLIEGAPSNPAELSPEEYEKFMEKCKNVKVEFTPTEEIWPGLGEFLRADFSRFQKETDDETI